MFDEGEIKQHKLPENNDGCHVVATVSCLKRVKIVSPVILRMNFFEAVVDTVYETSEHLILQSNHIPAACFATQPGGEMKDGRWGEGKEGGSEAERRK